jgi:flavin reductase (DIM6/NTAB) family NADH-FMN oxidoreductase RutF
MTVTSNPLPGQLVPADDLRRLLRRQASTVSIITAAGADRPVGFTATSFTSVSLRPPLISFCVALGSASWQAIATTGHAAVHFLGAGQAELARTFATRGIDRFTVTAWRPGPYGVPLLDGAVAWLVCRITERIAAGDHVIVLAQPVAAEYGEQSPLLYHNGRYAELP